jgi:hypothetical protein
MPATTRSKNQQKQTHLEDFTDKEPQEEKAGSPKPKRTNVKKSPKASSKRKGTDDGEEAPFEKKQKQAPTKTDEDTGSSESSKPVIINRAPVLHLWAACVAEKLYPNLSWTTHLSIGSAISALCAVSKGRAIGKIEAPSDDPDTKAATKKKKEAAKEGADEEVEVMGFKLQLKDGRALVLGKPQKGVEELLRKKYREDYERVRKTMREAVRMFKSTAEREELSRTAFHMYEEFRPSVQRGQGGWGKRGELRLEKVMEVARK